jgi:hypothetical protein
MIRKSLHTIFALLILILLFPYSGESININITVLNSLDSLPIPYIKIDNNNNNDLLAFTDFNGNASFKLRNNIKPYIKLSRSGIKDTILHHYKDIDTFYIDFGYYDIKAFDVIGYKKNIKKYWQSIHNSNNNKNNTIRDTTLYYSLKHKLFFQKSENYIEIYGILKLKITNYGKSNENISSSIHNTKINYNPDLLNNWQFTKFPNFPISNTISIQLHTLQSNNIAARLKEISLSFENDSNKVFSAKNKNSSIYKYLYAPDSSLYLVTVCDSNYNSLYPKSEYFNRYTKYTLTKPRLISEHYFLQRHNFIKIKDELGYEQNYIVEFKITLLNSIPNCDKGILWPNSYFTYLDLIEKYEKQLQQKTASPK